MAAAQEPKKKQEGDTSNFRIQVEAALRQRVLGAEGLAPGTDSLVQISGSASNFIYHLKVALAGGSVRHVCFRKPMFQRPDILHLEAALMRAARLQGAPVPEVLGILQEGDAIDKGIFMEWADGEGKGDKIVAIPALSQEGFRDKLGRQCGAALAHLHAVDTGPFVEKLQRLPISARDTVEMYRRDYDKIGVCRPAMDYTLQWLAEHASSTSEEPVIIHGDFRTGNIVVHPEQGLVAVLDWETVHLGNRYEDLGWLCIPSWRFGHWEHPVGGFAAVDALCLAYEHHSGHQVDREKLQWWTVLGQFRWAWLCLGMGSGFSADINRLEHGVVGRRTSEAELDCLLLIAETAGGVQRLIRTGDVLNQESSTTNSSGGNAPSRERDDAMFPSSANMVESVQQHLRRNMLAALTRAGDARGAYMARVAANVLGMVARSLQDGPRLHAEELAFLTRFLAEQGLLGEPEARSESILQLRRRLAHGLRTGQTALDTPGLLWHLVRFTGTQLSIDQPKYPSLSFIRSML